MRINIALALSIGISGFILAGANLPVDTQITHRTKLGERTQPYWLVPAQAQMIKVRGGSGLIRLFGAIAGTAGFGLAMHFAGTDEREQHQFWLRQSALDAVAQKTEQTFAEIDASIELNKKQMEAQAEVDLFSLRLQQNFQNAIGYVPPRELAQLTHGKPGTLDEITDPGDKVQQQDYEVIDPNLNLDISRRTSSKILNSLAGIKTSIFLAAPTRCGKTHTLCKWLADLTTRFPRANVYVISQKYEAFPGVSSSRLTVFDAMQPEQSMTFLDEVYDKLLERKSKPATEDTYRDCPVKLVLEDWFATYQCLSQKKNAALWESVAAKLGMIVTVGGQYNVGYFICTQSFNIASSGVADSNIRLNLALIAQGLVRTTENGEQQGSYAVIEQMLNNHMVIANKLDRDVLTSSLKILIGCSMAEQTPIIFSTIGTPELGLMPKIEVRKPYLDTAPTAPDRTALAQSPAPLLDKALSGSRQPHHPIPQGWKMASPDDITPVVRGVMVACIRAGWGQTKTIQEVFGIVKSGNNPNYDLAREVFQQIKDLIN